MICLDNPLFMLLLHSVWIRKLENKHGIVIHSCLAKSVLSCSKSWFIFQKLIPHSLTVCLLLLSVGARLLFLWPVQAWYQIRNSAVPNLLVCLRVLCTVLLERTRRSIHNWCKAQPLCVMAKEYSTASRLKVFRKPFLLSPQSTSKDLFNSPHHNNFLLISPLVVPNPRQSHKYCETWLMVYYGLLKESQIHAILLCPVKCAHRLKQI